MILPTKPLMTSGALLTLLMTLCPLLPCQPSFAEENPPAPPSQPTTAPGAQPGAPATATSDDQAFCADCIKKATQLFKEKMDVEAAELLAGAQSKCQENYQFQLLLSTAFMHGFNKKAAVAAAEKAMALNATAVAPRLQYAFLVSQEGKFEPAIDALQQVIKVDPENFEAWSMLADLYKKTHQDELAKQSALQAATLAKPNQVNRTGLLNNLIRQRKLNQAQEELKNLIYTSASNPETSKQLAVEALSLGYFDEAEQASENVLRYVPGFEPALVTKATALLFMGKYQDALNTCQIVSKANKNNEDAHALIALSLLYLGRPAEAEEELGKLDLRKANSPILIMALGKWHQTRGDLLPAEQAFGSISDGAMGKKSHLLLARLYLEQGKFDEAIGEATFDVTSPAIAAEALATRAYILATQSNLFAKEKSSEKDRLLTRARSLKDESEKQIPGNANAKIAAARIALASGNLDEAKSLSNDVLKQMPGSAEAYVISAKALGDTDDKTKEELLTKALTLSDDNPEICFALANLSLKQGNAKRAIDLLKAALSNQTTSEICYVLAKALDLEGDGMSALKYYKQSLSLGLIGADSATAKQAIERLAGKQR